MLRCTYIGPTLTIGGQNFNFLSNMTYSDTNLQGLDVQGQHGEGLENSTKDALHYP